MTSVAKKARGSKNRKAKLPLPAKTEKAVIGGTEYLIIPSADFEDWYTDQMLAAVAADRLNNERKQAVPWADVVARLRKGVRGKAKAK